MRQFLRIVIAVTALVGVTAVMHWFGHRLPPMNDLPSPGLGRCALLTFLAAVTVTVAGLVVSLLCLAVTVVAEARWIERLLELGERLWRMLPKRPPPLSELHKDARKDKARAQRFL